MTRYLVTTALEASWPADQPLMFLGDWCRRFDRVPAWSDLDAGVAPPFGVSVEERASNIAAVKRTAAALLPELAAALNRVHGTSHSTRYWEIILGHWLLRCVAMVFNRYGNLVQALGGSAVDRTIVFDASDYHFATQDSESFKWACNDDLWNHVLYARILAELGGIALEVKEEPLRGIRGFRMPIRSAPQPITRRARLAALTSRILPIFSRRTDALIVSTYLPLKERLRLELSLGQFPQVWRSPAIEAFSPDVDLRARMAVSTVGYDGFDHLLRVLLRELIPTCYLEGYGAMCSTASELPWPSEPRFIYAANNWDTDELFKAWTAMKVERGTPYVTGQHGNNYGTHVWSGAEWWPERSTADRFITWGWSNSDSRNVPAFNFRVAGRKSPATRPDGGLLLVELTLPHRTEPHDVVSEFGVYQEEQFRFVEALPERVRAQVTVRLYGEFRRHTWHDDDRWRQRSPGTTIETGEAPISSLVAQSRLVVHSYDSTGILEGLALNSPLMCFWHGGLNHLVPLARRDYGLLHTAGILHHTPEDAAASVAKHWDDIDAWWHGEEVQQARAAFCERYSRQVSEPVRVLRQALIDAQLAGAPR